ncbi:hypothetical protein [Terrarubrum flagellatum]|uniref:hypothetical protein n=1 Tax=Terrirubrum flagellatum TaxID=2895980 RepID=UPI003145486C
MIDSGGERRVSAASPSPPAGSSSAGDKAAKDIPSATVHSFLDFRLRFLKVRKFALEQQIDAVERALADMERTNAT